MTVAVTSLLSIPKGTYGITLSFTVYNNDGTAHDLTTYVTVKFQVWKSGIPGTLKVDGDCAGMAIDGTCHYIVIAADFDTVDRYLWHLALAKAGYEDHTDAGQLVVTEAG